MTPLTWIVAAPIFAVCGTFIRSQLTNTGEDAHAFTTSAGDTRTPSSWLQAEWLMVPSVAIFTARTCWQDPPAPPAGGAPASARYLLRTVSSPAGSSPKTD